jgi:orotidine-5'-phosphate decarboxylase
VGQREIIKAATKARGNSALQILVVTLLTYMNQDDLRTEYETKMPISAFVRARAKFAASEGCDGVISSAQEVNLIREATLDHPDFVIVTPGIRPAGASFDDQKRVATPGAAILNGSNYLVIGRPIVQANQKKEAAEAILLEIQRALNNLPAPEERQRAIA